MTFSGLKVNGVVHQAAFYITFQNGFKMLNNSQDSEQPLLLHKLLHEHLNCHLSLSRTTRLLMPLFLTTHCFPNKINK